MNLEYIIQGMTKKDKIKSQHWCSRTHENPGSVPAGLGLPIAPHFPGLAVVRVTRSPVPLMMLVTKAPVPQVP